MLKHLSICAALVALTAAPVHAEEQQAFLQTIEVPGSGFSFVLAGPEPEGGTVPNLGSSPDALVVHLQGGKLAVAFEDPGSMLRALEYLKKPVCAFEVDGERRAPAQPFALYVIPKHQWIAVGDHATGMQWVGNARWPALVPNDTAGLP